MLEKKTHVELDNGYTRIANELLEVLFLFDFSGMEYKLLFHIIRLSYGCGKKTVSLRSWSDCECFGIYKQNVKPLLARLNDNKVLAIDWENKILGLNKYYEFWTVPIKEVCDGDKLRSLRDYNIKSNGDITEVMRILLNSAESHNNIALKVMNSLLKSCQPTQMGNENITKSNEDITFKSVDTNKIKPSDPLKERKEIKRSSSSVTNNTINTGSKELATLDREEIIQFGFYLNSIYELCNPTAEDHLGTLTEIVKAKDKQTILDGIEQLKQARISLPDRLDWLHDYLMESKDV